MLKRLRFNFTRLNVNSSHETICFVFVDIWESPVISWMTFFLRVKRLIGAAAMKSTTWKLQPGHVMWSYSSKTAVKRRLVVSFCWMLSNLLVIFCINPPIVTYLVCKNIFKMWFCDNCFIREVLICLFCLEKLLKRCLYFYIFNLSHCDLVTFELRSSKKSLKTSTGDRPLQVLLLVTTVRNTQNKQIQYTIKTIK